MPTGSAERVAEAMARQLWTLERFALSPRKVRTRIWNPHGPRVFCVSIPKAGTHLLERALCLHPLLYRKLVPTVSDENIGKWGGLDRLLRRVRNGQVIASHLPYRTEYPELIVRNGFRGIFMIRNPRDIVVSQVFYVSRRTDHRHHDIFGRHADVRQKLRLAIGGDPSSDLPSIGEKLQHFEGWLGSGCHVVRFEELVGSAGGGHAQQQRTALRDLFAYLGLREADHYVDLVSQKLFSRQSPTFRAGSIGEWERYFDDELEELFRRSVGQRAARYGY